MNLYSMEYRRLRGDMIQVYKILHNIDRLDKEELFSLCERTGRGHSLKLLKKRYEKDTRKYAFSQRVTNEWNSLTEEIVTANSLNAFKSKLDKFWKSKWYQISTE